MPNNTLHRTMIPLRFGLPVSAGVSYIQIIIKRYVQLQVFLFLFISNLVFSESVPAIEDFKREYASYQKYADIKQWKDSLEHAKNAYEIGMALFGESSKNASALAYNYGLNLMELRKNDEAEKILKEALDIYEKVYGKNSIELIPVLSSVPTLIK